MRLALFPGRGKFRSCRSNHLVTQDLQSKVTIALIPAARTATGSKILPVLRPELQKTCVWRVLQKRPPGHLERLFLVTFCSHVTLRKPTWGQCWNANDCRSAYLGDMAHTHFLNPFPGICQPVPTDLQSCVNMPPCSGGLQIRQRRPHHKCTYSTTSTSCPTREGSKGRETRM